MARCEWTDRCVFFTDEVGYSIELQDKMRNDYCLGDNSTCARLKALSLIPLTRLPDDLIPTDHESLVEVVREFEREVCKRCREEQPGACD